MELAKNRAVRELLANPPKPSTAEPSKAATGATPSTTSQPSSKLDLSSTGMQNIAPQLSKPTTSHHQQSRAAHQQHPQKPQQQPSTHTQTQPDQETPPLKEGQGPRAAATAHDRRVQEPQPRSRSRLSSSRSRPSSRDQYSDILSVESDDDDDDDEFWDDIAPAVRRSRRIPSAAEHASVNEVQHELEQARKTNHTLTAYCDTLEKKLEMAHRKIEVLKQVSSSTFLLWVPC